MVLRRRPPRVLPARGRRRLREPAGARGRRAGARRPAPRRTPLADAFAAAADELGHPAEPDKNADGPPGYGPVPLTVSEGVRINTAMAYLSPRRGRPGLSVRGGVRVLRVVVDGGRAVGVETTDGIVRAAEVVLSAGAVCTPHLLLLSGIGPADELRSVGQTVVADLPGVGAGATDHPVVYVGFRPVRPVPLEPGRPPLHGVLHATSAGAARPGDLELLPWLAPFSAITGAAPAGDDPAIGVALQCAESRGRLSLASGDPREQPRLEYRYLTEESDRRRMRDGVRLAVALLRAGALAPLVVPGGPPPAVLDRDAELDRWVRTHLTTAVHLAGTARMGPEDDPGAVVDQWLRVRGVAGLRVADASVMPEVTSRGRPRPP
ncbi:GMC family oxidoreductase [Blastococcus brunescens]|uniref:GMC oxidoreductase n=1 Tax=Blastococcus brunescens TaxID=1564165 RepID=A0ABZ1B8Q6_9ACTN|nr:GMC oxidoreductase [Blastococcus sp. BMG 8361]WRL67175.1 GMC oxidoreductase [Blastococcus sp. BMG 8361]